MLNHFNLTAPTLDDHRILVLQTGVAVAGGKRGGGGLAVILHGRSAQQMHLVCREEVFLSNELKLKV